MHREAWIWTGGNSPSTHLVWPHQQDKPTREAQGLADQSIKKPILVFLKLPNQFSKALRLVAPNVCWSSMFHLLTTLLEKDTSNSPECTSFYLILAYDLLFPYYGGISAEFWKILWMCSFPFPFIPSLPPFPYILSLRFPFLSPLFLPIFQAMVKEFGELKPGRQTIFGARWAEKNNASGKGNFSAVYETIASADKKP